MYIFGVFLYDMLYYQVFIQVLEKVMRKMFLKQIKQKNGRVRLAIYESYRDGKTPRQRSVKPLGYLDELKKKAPRPSCVGKSTC